MEQMTAVFCSAVFLLLWITEVSSVTTIFCPYLDLSEVVYGQEDVPLDMYSAWRSQGSFGQLFHSGCIATLPSDPRFTCETISGVILLTSCLKTQLFKIKSISSPCLSPGLYSSTNQLDSRWKSCRHIHSTVWSTCPEVFFLPLAGPSYPSRLRPCLTVCLAAFHYFRPSLD
jgi:hypothetical protein